jgi:putative NADH-flavin reductase
MRLTVFGATGGTGTQVVTQALDAGHEVVAVVRDPARLPVPAAPGLTVVKADVMDVESILPAVETVDGVVSALGPPQMSKPTTVCADGTRSVVRAMGKAGVRRLVVVSANGAYVDDGDGLITRLVAKPILQRLLREAFVDLRRMEDEVRASATDWTIVRPPRLTNGRHRGKYRTAVDRNVGITISRADLADAILKALDDPRTAGHSLGVGY